MRTQGTKGLFWSLLFIFIFLITGCRREETPTPTPTLQVPTLNTPAGTDGAAQGQAFVESLQVVTLESFPVQVQATVNGSLSDGCTSLVGINVTQQGATFLLDVQTVRNDTGACTQALVPFSQAVSLNVQGLAAGTYTVTAGNVSQTFTLAVDNVLPGTPVSNEPTGNASLAVSAASATPGQAVTLTGQGFPANTMVEIGVGPANSEYGIIASAQAGADGVFTSQVTVPANAVPGEQWVFVAVSINETVLANPVLIQASGETGDGGQEGDMGEDNWVNEVVNGRIERTYIFLIALEDGGQSGTPVGCGDSVIPVIIDIEPTIAPMTAAYNRLLSIKDQYYGQSGLYNALYQSDLTLSGINIVNRVATVSLTGTLSLAGECDDPRVLAQLREVALQYSTVDSVTILLNGQPIENQLGGQ